MVETLRSHCHTYQVCVNDSLSNFYRHNSPASTEESKAILFSPLCACVSVYVSLFAAFRVFLAPQGIFGLSFKTVLKPSLVTVTPIIPCAFWGGLT